MDDRNNTGGSQHRTPTQRDMNNVATTVLKEAEYIAETEDMSVLNEKITNNKIAYQSDEGRTVTTKTTLSDSQMIEEELAKGGQVDQQQCFSQARRECLQANENLKGIYYTKPEDMQSVGVEEIESAFSSDNMQQSKIHSANAEFTNWHGDDISYKHCTYKVGNTTKQFKLAKVNVSWGSQFKEGVEYIPRNIEVLRSLVTKGIYELYGGWNRIMEIAVVDCMLIINGVCYFQTIDDTQLCLFPLDTVDYIKNGCVAPFFDWKYLKDMKRLSVLSIDDEMFYANEVANDLRLSRNIGVASIFHACSNLMTFILRGRVIHRDELYSDRSVPMKKSLARVKRNMVFSDGYKINVYDATNGVQDYMFGNLKTYATNRGNKGLFRFCLGTTVRAGLAGVSGIVNASTHLLGGVFHVLKEMCTDSAVIQN